MRRALLLAAAAAAFLVAPAGAYVVAGHPWANHRITYYKRVKAADWAVRRAVADSSRTTSPGQSHSTAGSRTRSGTRTATRGAPSAAPAGLTAAGDPASSPDVHLRWRDAAAPKALIPGLGGVQLDLSVVLAVDQSRCSTDPQHDGYLLSVAAKPGQAQDVVATSFASLAPGQYCFTAWTQDALGRHSPPDTAQFTVGP